MITVTPVPGKEDKVAVVRTSGRKTFWLQGITYAVLTAAFTIALAFAFSGPSQERSKQIQQEVDSILCILAAPVEDRDTRLYEKCGINITALERRTGIDFFPEEGQGDSRRQPER